MATVNLPFGRDKISVTIPDSRLNGILLSGAHSYHPDGGEEEIVRNAMENPIESPRLRALVKGKKNIVMIASDHTRPVPSRVIMPAVMAEIKEGNPEATLTILIATGFHRPTTREELIDKFGESIVERDDIRFLVHESQKDEDMVFIDTLPSGGRLLINRVAAEADL